jgi:predicted nucleic acid-binding Zn ribbon protein
VALRLYPDDQMPEDHRHCIVCGKAVGSDKFFCSPSCEDIFKKQQKRMARTRLIMMVIFVLLFALIVVLSYLR